MSCCEVTCFSFVSPGSLDTNVKNPIHCGQPQFRAVLISLGRSLAHKRLVENTARVKIWATRRSMIVDRTTQELSRDLVKLHASNLVCPSEKSKSLVWPKGPTVILKKLAGKIWWRIEFQVKFLVSESRRWKRAGAGAKKETPRLACAFWTT
jgi:hypothetical protein